jgi:hypothetical protein
MWWIITLVVVGIALAVVVGVLGTRNEPSESKTEAIGNLCTSLNGLEGSLTALTGLSSSSSATDIQSGLTAVHTSWSQVETDAQSVKNAPTGQLDSAWNDLVSAVKAVPSSGSVSDAVSSVTKSADAFVSAAKSTASEISC